MGAAGCLEGMAVDAISVFIMFERNLQILSRHKDVPSIHFRLPFKTGLSYICVVAQSPL
jgi:hypothetical protein